MCKQIHQCLGHVLQNCMYRIVSSLAVCERSWVDDHQFEVCFYLSSCLRSSGKRGAWRHTGVVHLHILVHGVPSVRVDEKSVVTPCPVLTAVRVLWALVAWVVHIAHELALPSPHDTRIPAWSSLACRWAVCIVSKSQHSSNCSLNT